MDGAAINKQGSAKDFASKTLPRSTSKVYILAWKGSASVKIVGRSFCEEISASA
jgi:hypothetical protein